MHILLLVTEEELKVLLRTYKNDSQSTIFKHMTDLQTPILVKKNLMNILNSSLYDNNEIYLSSQ